MASEISILPSELLGKVLFVGTTIYEWNKFSRVCKQWNQLFNEHIKSMGRLYFRDTMKLVADEIDAKNMHCEFTQDMLVRLWFNCTVLAYGNKTDCEIIFCIPIAQFRQQFSYNELFAEIVQSPDLVPDMLIQLFDIEIYKAVSESTSFEVVFKINENEYRVKYEGGLIREFMINNRKCLSLLITAAGCEFVRATIFPAILNTFGNVFPRGDKISSGYKFLCEIRGALKTTYDSKCYYF